MDVNKVLLLYIITLYSFSDHVLGNYTGIFNCILCNVVDHIMSGSE